MNKEEICKNCRHWKNEQAELDYDTHYGFCTTPKNSFNTNIKADARVYNRVAKCNVYMGTGQFESISDTLPFGTRNYSNYCLVTEKEFGCVHFKK